MVTEHRSLSFNLLWLQMEVFLLHVMPRMLGLAGEAEQEVEVDDASLHDASYKNNTHVFLASKLELPNFITQIS